VCVCVCVCYVFIWYGHVCKYKPFVLIEVSRLTLHCMRGQKMAFHPFLSGDDLSSENLKLQFWNLKKLWKIGYAKCMLLQIAFCWSMFSLIPTPSMFIISFPYVLFYRLHIPIQNMLVASPNSCCILTMFH